MNYRTLIPAALVIFLVVVVAAALFGGGKEAPNQTATPGQEDNQTSGNNPGQVTRGKPGYFFFYDDGCPACALMERTTLSNQTILRVLSENFTFRRVNTAKNPELRMRYRIMYVPTNVFTYPNGTEIGRVVGAVGERDFMRVLSKVLEIYYGKLQSS